MSEELLIDGKLNTPCWHCWAGSCTGTVTEAVADGQVMWTTAWRCDTCGHTSVRRERADPHDHNSRQAVIAGCGLARLRGDTSVNAPVRRRLFGVFRRRGATIAEVAASYAALTGPGLLGTPAEMHLLATELTTEGATVTVTAEPAT